MIEFLKLRACLVRIKVVTPSNGARAAIATHKQYSTVARQRTSVCFKLAVRGDTRAGGLVVLYCVQHTTVSKLYCLAVPCHSKRWPSPFVPVLQPSLT